MTQKLLRYNHFLRLTAIEKVIISISQGRHGEFLGTLPPSLVYQRSLVVGREVPLTKDMAIGAWGEVTLLRRASRHRHSRRACRCVALLASMAVVAVVTGRSAIVPMALKTTRFDTIQRQQCGEGNLCDYLPHIGFLCV